MTESCTFQSGTIISVSERTLSWRKRSNGISAGSRAATAAAITASRVGRRAPPVDPDEQGDQQERRDDEHVSLLDRAREARGERGDHEQRPAPEGEGGDDELLRPRIEGASADGEEDERGEREDADVEIELGDVPEEEAQHLGQVVALLADDGVGAEQAL